MLEQRNFFATDFLGEVCTHSITEYFGLEGTLTGHLFQPPAMSRDIFNYIRLLRASDFYNEGDKTLTQAAQRDGTGPIPGNSQREKL